MPTMLLRDKCAVFPRMIEVFNGMLWTRLLGDQALHKLKLGSDAVLPRQNRCEDLPVARATW